MEIKYYATENAVKFAEPGAFAPMIKQAEALIRDSGFKDNGCANALVVMTAKGNTFGAVTEDGRMEDGYCACADKVLKQLTDSRDTEVKMIVCLWDGGPLDISSFYFREKLCSLNESNKNAEILLEDADGGYFIIKVARTFGKKSE